jgi:hypothetical protein
MSATLGAVGLASTGLLVLAVADGLLSDALLPEVTDLLSTGFAADALGSVDFSLDECLASFVGPDFVSEVFESMRLTTGVVAIGSFDCTGAAGGGAGPSCGSEVESEVEEF